MVAGIHLTKNVYSNLAPLVFLIFVTNKRFSACAPLYAFRKGKISKSDAIIFSGICSKQGIFKMCLWKKSIMKSIRISGNVIASKRQTIASYDAIAIKIKKQVGQISNQNR